MKRKLSNVRASEIKKWSSISGEILKKLESHQVFINFGDSSSVLYESECLRATSELLPESAVRNLFLKCMLDAETRSPGGSLAMLHYLSGNVLNRSHGAGLRFNLKMLSDSLVTLVGQDAADLCLSAVKISGRRGKILLDPSASSQSEICYGTQVCHWKPDQSFFLSVGQSRVTLLNCRIVFIDGIVESVAECHHLFNESYERKIPIVVFARGFAEEVQATAAVNMKRQTAQIVPIVIPFDEVGVNGMADLANCFMSELISSDKGQLISSIKLDDAVQANRISCSSSGTEIESSSNRSSSVVTSLIQKLKISDSMQSELLRKRLSYLGDGMVTIKIGSEKKSLIGIQRDRVDFGLRYIRKCMADGVVHFENFYLPAGSVKVGESCANSFNAVVQNCSVILEVDKCG